MSASRIRCAIYTRKSTEDGLEQAFNSLDAQREACAAYVLSQRHEGWTLLPDAYDDGGYSGGSMERPALKRLLAEVEAGKVDVIVVYKVDRLTRSLSDFAKIVEILDARGASFVSVTQAFNTTSSMGRLTLNVLLSFAQFEREVTGERIRDKIAASKKKGLWMGGPVPLGYDVQDRKLIVNDAEAATVRHIYSRYAELRSMRLLAAELTAAGIRSRERSYTSGRRVGGRPFSAGALAHLLANPVYAGQVKHKDQVYPGEHPAIVDVTLWDEVNVIIHTSGAAARSGLRAEHPTPLAGRIIDPDGQPMTSDHAKRHGRRYRYYVSRPGEGQPEHTAKWRIPAGTIEDLVATRLAEQLREPRLYASLGVAADAIGMMVARVAVPLAPLTQRSPAALRRLVLDLDAKVIIHPDRLELQLDAAALMRLLDTPVQVETGPISITIPATFVRRGQELRLAFPPDDHRAPRSPDAKLVELIAKAEQAWTMLVNDASSVDPAQRPHLTRLARLRFLAPDIVSAILDGRQPVSLTARALLRIGDLPVAWEVQREVLGFA